MTSMFSKVTKCQKNISILNIILIFQCACLFLILYFCLIYDYPRSVLFKHVKFDSIKSSTFNKQNDPCKKYISSKRLILKKHPTVPSNCKNRIIIVSQYRTGSSFFGDLLQQSWPTYYLYEPLYFLGETVYIDQIKEKRKVVEAMNTMVDLYNCKCLNETRNKKKIHWALHWNQIMNTFKSQKEKLSNSEQVCQKCKNLLIKSVRINIKFVVNLFNNINYAHNPLKTVVLLRDPRAIINSRLNPSLGFCFGKCRDPGIVCQQIRSNIKSLVDLKGNSSILMDHLTIIRYEDLSLNTKSVAKKLFKRLGLSYTKKVEEWIQNKTRQKRNNLKTPLRNTTENVITWIKTFSDWKMDLNLVQNQCSDVMHMLGYKKISLQELSQSKKIDHGRLVNKNFPLKKLLIKNFI